MKIKRIKKIILEHPEPVYDISVNKFNNFAITKSNVIVHNCNYNHGDVSACDTIIKMSQDFCGANNLVPFLKDGSFGNRLVNDASAPRYIYSKPNPIFYRLYKDYEIVTPDDDLDNPEPYYYLPIIPTILLNGTKGIAVGFATEIQPYNIKDIKRYIKQYLKNGESSVQLAPYFKGYTGEILFDQEIEKYVMIGKYEKVNNTTIKITELPVGFQRESYLKHLTSLIDKGIINKYIDNSKNDWNITIKLSKSSKLFEDPIHYLKLRQILNENITVLDENRQIKVFKDVYDLFNYFIEFRKTVYTERKKYMTAKIKNDILFTQAKIKFIKIMCSINFKKMSKKDIENFILSKKCNPEYLKRLMDIKVHKLNRDEIKKCLNDIEEMKVEYKWYKKITINELYEIDLKEI